MTRPPPPACRSILDAEVSAAGGAASASSLHQGDTARRQGPAVWVHPRAHFCTPHSEPGSDPAGPPHPRWARQRAVLLTAVPRRPAPAGSPAQADVARHSMCQDAKLTTCRTRQGLGQLVRHDGQLALQLSYLQCHLAPSLWTLDKPKHEPTPRGLSRMRNWGPGFPGSSPALCHAVHSETPAPRSLL